MNLKYPDVGRVKDGVAQCIVCGTRSPLQYDEIAKKPAEVRRLCRSCEVVTTHVTRWFVPKRG